MTPLRVGPLFWMIGTILLCLHPILVLAQPNTDRSRIETFAESLLRHHQFSRARTEYQRLASYFADDADEATRCRWAARAVQCFRFSGEALAGRQWLLEQIPDFRTDTLRGELWVEAGLSAMAVNESDPLALAFFDSSCVLGTASIAARSKFYKALVFVHRFESDSALASFSDVREPHTHSALARRFASLVKPRSQLPHKNPTAAALLGTLPGAGYLYAGHPQTALATVVVVGLLGWGTVTMWHEKQYGVGHLVGLVTLGWYTGSMYGSAQSAQRYNEFLEQHYLSQFQK